MRQSTGTIDVSTAGKGFFDVTRRLVDFVCDAGIRDGLLTVFVRHTSASLVIQENADPDVRVDMEAFFSALVPEGAGLYLHAAEGVDDMPSHIRSALTQTQLSIPVIDGRPALGTWQGVYLFEHRARPHRRSLALHVIGE